MQVTIDKVFKSIKDTSFGKRLSVGLKVREATVMDINGREIAVGDKFINCFLPETYDFNYNEGDTIDILIKQKITPKGEFLNFSIPKDGGATLIPSSVQADRYASLEARLKVIEDHLDINAGSDEDVPDPEDF